MPKMGDRTRTAVRRQLEAMCGDNVEIGVREEESGKTMIRQWSPAEVENSLGWLKRCNARGCHIYVRLHGSHGLLLLDDVGLGTIERMKQDGLEPALVVETSPMNFQAWVRVSYQTVAPQVVTQAAKLLAKRYGADRASADYRHFGRLAGFTNPKPTYAQQNGRFPFVLLRESSKGKIASRGADLIAEATAIVRGQSTAMKTAPLSAGVLCSKKAGDPVVAYQTMADHLMETYGRDADLSRVDWMTITELLHQGFSEQQVKAAMCAVSPRLQERKRNHVEDYINRTVEKAVVRFGQGHQMQGDATMTNGTGADGKQWEQRRKARTHQLIKVGGLADIAGLAEADPGALLGGLLVIADILKDEATFTAYKRHGDAVLRQRAEARKGKTKHRAAG